MNWQEWAGRDLGEGTAEKVTCTACTRCPQLVAAMEGGGCAKTWQTISYSVEIWLANALNGHCPGGQHGTACRPCIGHGRQWKIGLFFLQGGTESWPALHDTVHGRPDVLALIFSKEHVPAHAP